MKITLHNCLLAFILSVLQMPIFAQDEFSYLQFANHTNLTLTTDYRITGAEDMVSTGQEIITPWQNPNYHEVGDRVTVVILDIVFGIYVEHVHRHFLAKCDRLGIFGDNDYGVEIDILHDENLLFTAVYSFNDIPLTFNNPTRYSIRYPDGTMDTESPYSLLSEGFNAPHEANREFMIDGTSYKLIYGTFRENIDPTGDVIFSLSESDPVSYHMEPDVSDLSDPNILNVVTYNPGILMPANSNDQEEIQRTAVTHKAMPKNMDIIVWQEFFQPYYSRRIMDSMQVDYPYRTRILNSQNIIPGVYLSGGVAIVSKWPILETREFSFQSDGVSEPSGIDVLSDKGVMYAKIDKMGQIIHVFGTHTYGINEDNTAMGKWIQETVAPNRDDIVIMAGDQNTGAISGQYYTMIDTFNALEPTYKSLLNPKRQSGTVWPDNHFINGGSGPDEGGNTIDYILCSEDFKFPIEYYNSVQAYRLNSTDRSFWGIYDLGDHQPVYGRFVFPSIQEEEHDSLVCPGDNFSLEVSTSLEEYIVRWKKDGEIIEGENQLILSRENIQEEDWGSYTCELLYSYSPDESINSLFGRDINIDTVAEIEIVSYDTIVSIDTISQDPLTIIFDTLFVPITVFTGDTIISIDTGRYYYHPGEKIGMLVREFNVMPDPDQCFAVTSVFDQTGIEIDIFPNPIKNYLNIELSHLNSNYLDFDVRVYNAEGKVLYKKTIQDRTQIYVEQWPSGNYFVDVRHDGQTVASKVLTK